MTPSLSSLRFTTAAIAVKSAVGWTRSHANCRALDLELPAAGRSGMASVLF